MAVTLVDFRISPATLTVQGSILSLAVVNDGPTPHNLTVRDINATVVGATADLRRQETAPLVVHLAPGDYVLFCSLPGHESLGMRSTLAVKPS